MADLEALRKQRLAGDVSPVDGANGNGQPHPKES